MRLLLLISALLWGAPPALAQVGTVPPAAGQPFASQRLTPENRVAAPERTVPPIEVQPPEVALMPAPGTRLPPATRGTLAEALRERGATLVNVPSKVPPATPDALARALNADATLEVGLVGTRARGYQARITVVDRQGNVRFDGSVPLRQRTLGSEEAGTLASLAVRSLEPPSGWVAPNIPPDFAPVPVAPPSVAGPPPPQPAQDFTTLPPILQEQEGIPHTNAPQVPSPQQLRITHLYAGPTLTWRTQNLTTPLPGNHADLRTTSPYWGLALGADVYPWAKGFGQYIGFGLSYSFSALRLNFPGFTTTQRATEHEFTGDVLGRVPHVLFGGDLVLHAGVAYDGLLSSTGSPLTTTVHVGPRLGLGYAHDLPAGLRLLADASLRPFAYTGNALRNTFGPDASSLGFDASVGLSGPIPFIAPGLRWTAGYAYMRYDDTFHQGTATTNQVVSQNRVGLGLTYERPF